MELEMKKGKLPASLRELLRCVSGSARYGYEAGSKDADHFILSVDEEMKVSDVEEHTDHFVTSVGTFRHFWGHPLIMGSITGACTGEERLCAFLRRHRHELAYAAPSRMVLFGLEHIAQGEAAKYDPTVKQSLRTAMILSHMAAEAEDPFLLSDEEKAVLIRARTGEVPPEERVEIYRRTLRPEDLDKLRRMPEDTAVRDELFALLDDIAAQLI